MKPRADHSGEKQGRWLILIDNIVIAWHLHYRLYSFGAILFLIAMGETALLLPQWRCVYSLAAAVMSLWFCYRMAVHVRGYKNAIRLTKEIEASKSIQWPAGRSQKERNITYVQKYVPKQKKIRRGVV